MLIDFTPAQNGEIKLYDFAQQFNIDDLRAATNASLDTILSIIGDADDAQLTFLPDDPNADDPLAPPEERYLGWSLAHLVAHVCASSEEAANYSAILAQGIPYPRDPRLRYETDWHILKTRAQVLQRLEESRRMRLAALDGWPDHPHLDTFRTTSEHGLLKNGPSNAKSAFLAGLKHEWSHLDQFRETARQALQIERATGD